MPYTGTFVTDAASPRHSSNPAPKRSGLTVSLWGDPKQPRHRFQRCHVAKRLLSLLEYNPTREFWLMRFTREAFVRLNLHECFTGTTDHSRSHPNETHRYAEIAAPESCAVIVKRNWHDPRLLDTHGTMCRVNGVWRPVLPPALLISPDLPRGQWPRTDAERELTCRMAWEAWEAATGTGKTTAEVMADLVSP